MRVHYPLLGGPVTVVTVATPQVVTWTPTALTTRNFWLTAGPTWCFSDAGGTTPCADGDAIYTIRDRGTNSIIVSIATAAQRPLLRLNGGRWWIELDGVDDRIPFSANPFSGAEGEIAVVQYNLDASQQSLWDMGAVVGDWWAHGAGNIYDGFGCNTRRGPIAVTGGHATLASQRVYGVAASGSEWTNRLDDTTLFTTGTNTVSWAGSACLAGCPGSSGTFPNRRVGEAVGSSAVLSAGDRTSLYAYLKAQWGTP